MKTVFVLALVCAVAFAAPDDTALLGALSTAISTLWSNGNLSSITSKYGLTPSQPACSAAVTYPTASGSLATILAAKKITLCHYNSENAPFWSVSGVGFEVDLINAIVPLLNTQYNTSLTYTWFNVTAGTNYFNDLNTALAAGNCDAVLSDVTLTAARSQLVNFTCGYMSFSHGVLRSGLEPNRTLNSIAALNDTTVKVAIVAGSSVDFPGYGLTGANITKVSSIAAALNLALTNQVHAVVWDLPTLVAWLKANPACVNCSTFDDGKGTQPLAMFVNQVGQSSTPTPTPTSSTTPSPTTPTTTGTPITPTPTATKSGAMVNGVSLVLLVCSLFFIF